MATVFCCSPKTIKTLKFKDYALSFSTGNMKIVWTCDGKELDWFDRQQSEGREWMRRASQVKNVWIPYGE